MTLPTDVANCAFWYKSDPSALYKDLGVTNVASNGDTIEQLTDLSGLGNTGLQSTAGIRPVYNSIQGAIRMQSGQCFVVPSVYAGSTEGELWWLIRIPSQNTQKGFHTFHANSFSSHYTWSDGIIYDGALTTVRKTVGNPGDLTQWHVYSIASKAGLYQAFFDGAQIFTTATNAFFAPTTPSIGVTYGFNGDMYLGQVFGFTRYLSSTERAGLVSTALAAAPTIVTGARITQQGKVLVNAPLNNIALTQQGKVLVNAPLNNIALTQQGKIVIYQNTTGTYAFAQAI